MTFVTENNVSLKDKPDAEETRTLIDFVSELLRDYFGIKKSIVDLQKAELISRMEDNTQACI